MRVKTTQRDVHLHRNVFPDARNFECKNKSAARGRVVFKITTLSCSDGQKQVALSAARAQLGHYSDPVFRAG